ncbi:hypothetical protein [Nevskia soli]|uniref:hypothetical protein n=1 Tax=Nevskia soli TaxID=418856 RepID=UPI0012F939A6|nr:hypothetical protein [Nevskia soli]
MSSAEIAGAWRTALRGLDAEEDATHDELFELIGRQLKTRGMGIGARAWRRASLKG